MSTVERKRYTHLNLSKNELRNAVIQNLASAPSSPVEGQLYYNTGDDKLYVRKASSWEALDGDIKSIADAGNGYVTVTNGSAGDVTLDLDLSAIINDSGTGASDILSAQKVISRINAAIEGLSPKGNVKAATTAALPTSTYDNGTNGVGATITGDSNGALAAQDGVTLVANDRLLVKNQSTAAENGIYKLTQVGDGSNPFILTRTDDADDSSAIVPGMYTFIQEGTTYAEQGWILSTNGSITVGTTGLTFEQFNSSAIADGSITTAKLDADAVTTAKIAAGAVGTTELGADAVTGDKIADDAIGSEHVADNAITAAHLASNSVDSDELQSNSVTTAKIASSAVTGAKIAANAVTSGKIIDSGVISAKIAADAVDGSKIADDSIDSEHIADGSIDTAHIADSQVTKAKMGSGTATSYAADFVSGDFSGEDLSIAAATHGLGASKNLIVKVYENGAPNEEVGVKVSVADNGDVTISSNTAFDGHYLIMRAV